MPGLGIGVTRASFHSFDNLPDLIDMLMSFVTAGVMLPTVVTAGVMLPTVVTAGVMLRTVVTAGVMLPTVVTAGVMLPTVVTAGVMFPTVVLRILADIPSGPFDFVTSMLDMRLNTSTSVHNSYFSSSDSKLQLFETRVGIEHCFFLT